jgi:23S rRNA (cytidine1920-2'-O)/16S rRNA (cytidine1409-2'-O)-methyltransferase
MAEKTKERIDVLLVERMGVESREKAQRTIMAGCVFADGQRVDKPGTKISIDADIEIRGNALPYVSRGGFKLEKAMSLWPIRLDDKVCMDIGASTGGFTDCMLQNGARKVFSVDVGYGQLDWKLRNDPRVVNMERTNIRYVTAETIGEPIDFISIDVSFISLSLVLPVAKALLAEEGELVFLIKPQFEAGREQVKKHGVVKDAKVHQEVLERVLGEAKTLGFGVKALTYSPIKGPKGNIEFLAYASASGNEDVAIDVKACVEEAHAALKVES